MKKIILYSIILFAIVLTGLGASFLTSKRNAEKVAERYAGEISPLKGHLILFHDDKFEPYWLFKGEYVNLMAGSTFNVYVSFLGNIQTVP